MLTVSNTALQSPAVSANVVNSNRFKALRFGAATSPTSAQTVATLVEALVNENAKRVMVEGDRFVAQVPDITDKSRTHTVQAKGGTNPFSSDVKISQPDSVTVDSKPVKTIQDLSALGLTPKQQSLLEAHDRVTGQLEEIYKESAQKAPKVLESLSDVVGRPLQLDRSQPGAVAKLIRDLPARESLILTDTSGNLDGSAGNPINNLMTGDVPDQDVFNVHPIPVAFNKGTAQLGWVRFLPEQVRTIGKLPQHLAQVLDKLKSGLVPMHPYSIADANHKNPDTTIEPESKFDAFTLLSKRSAIPKDGDYQIKTSLPAQFTTAKRTLRWDHGETAVRHSEIARELAEQNRLPDNFWVLPDMMAGQANNDDHTTFYIRGGLRDAFGNNGQPLPDNLKPITSSAMWSRNILTPGKSIFESLVEDGFNAKELFSDISKALIGAQLKFVSTGFIPEMHSQNLIYLFDMDKKKFAGFLYRDCGGADIIPDKLRRFNIDYPDHTGVLGEALADPDKRKRFQSMYFYYVVGQKHIEPMAKLMMDKYGVSAEAVGRFIRGSINEWLKTYQNLGLENDIDLENVHARSLASFTLAKAERPTDFGEQDFYRTIPNHIFAPGTSSP